MSLSDPIDATAYDFDRWIRFAFDRAVSEPPWYYTEEMHFLCNPANVIAFYTRLFRNPRAVLSSYDDSRLEQGFWFIGAAQLSEWLWSDELSLDARRECIAAMPTMFREFFIDHPLETSCFMWWDMLRHFGDAPDPGVVEAMAGALDEVLHVSARHCRISALHGLGHLPRGFREEIGRRFLSENPQLDDEMVQYAHAAIEGML